jgi:hypothetical protein
MQQKRFALATYRLSVSLIAVGVVIAQVVNGFFHPPFDITNYFSFFSIQSNLFTAFVLALSALRIYRGDSPDNLTFWRGAAVLYLTLAGTVYLILLGGVSESLQNPREQTNAVLHYLVPTALLADWFLTPKKRVTFATGLLWLLYPLGYVLYSLGRGHFSHWYPYPFLTPSASGYVGIVSVCLVMAAAMVLFIGLLTWTTRREPGASSPSSG